MERETSTFGGGALLLVLTTCSVQASEIEGTASLWTALFGLAVIGVLALYLSSERVKSLTDQYRTMQASQKEIALRQDVILDVIGERLAASTQGIRRHREVLEEQSSDALDRDTIEHEMVRFRRDEHLLNDALGDLNDFAQVRSGKLTLEQHPFEMDDLLKSLRRQVEPYCILKHNTLIFRLDPELIGSAVGDVERIEQILRTFLIELGQVAYDSTLILAVHSDTEAKMMTFDLLVSESEGNSQFLDDVFGDVQMVGEIQRSSRKLKSYLARELIRLMGGRLYPVSDPEFGLHYRIDLPLVMT